MIGDKRNRFIDIMRGIAILLVILGHTMTGCTTNVQKSVLFNIVWSLQMPLFILISGYVTKYSKGIESKQDLYFYLKRRTRAYLIPWSVWSFFIRGIILDQQEFLSIRWLIWHMDSGYWFLATIWTISVIFGISCFFENQISKKYRVARPFFVLITYVMGMVILVGVGLIFGFSFFAIRLTLYYMPFYYLGYLYGQYKSTVLKANWDETPIEIVVAVSTVIWLLIITHYCLYDLSDSISNSIIRGMASITGCVAVSGLLNKAFSSISKPLIFSDFLCWCGKSSLEIYVSHYLFLNILKMVNTPSFSSIQGVAIFAANFFLTIFLTSMTVKILSSNRFLKIMLYGKAP